MKTLITLGIGIALGFAFKKPQRVKRPKFIMVDDRSGLNEHIFDLKGKEAFNRFVKTQN